jgi:hypothetical protein
MVLRFSIVSLADCSIWRLQIRFTSQARIWYGCLRGITHSETAFYDAQLVMITIPIDMNARQGLYTLHTRYA